LQTRYTGDGENIGEAEGDGGIKSKIHHQKVSLADIIDRWKSANSHCLPIDTELGGGFRLLSLTTQNASGYNLTIKLKRGVLYENKRTGNKGFRYIKTI
jgi:hypothetical protein